MPPFDPAHRDLGSVPLICRRPFEKTTIKEAQRRGSGSSFANCAIPCTLRSTRNARDALAAMCPIEIHRGANIDFISSIVLNDFWGLLGYNRNDTMLKPLKRRRYTSRPFWSNFNVGLIGQSANLGCCPKFVTCVYFTFRMPFVTQPPLDPRSTEFRVLCRRLVSHVVSFQCDIILAAATLFKR